MEIQGKVVVVTGAASGIGRGLVTGFAKAGARRVICVDYNMAGVRAVADEIDGHGIVCDVADEAQVKAMIDTVEDDFGPIDLFFGNAGIMAIGGAEVVNDRWQKIWEVNVMAHVYAARYLIPKMLARGGGYFVITASAAGVLSQIGSAPYSVTKHAAVSFAEWLAITYGTRGLKVSALCPQAVYSEMTKGFEEGVASLDGMLTPEEVFTACLKAIKEEAFFIFPHDKVEGYFQLRASDHNKWLMGMQRLNETFGGEVAKP